MKQSSKLRNRNKTETESFSLCPICSKMSRIIAHGAIAPWIVELANTVDIFTTLRLCNNCGLRYFTYRYNEKEANGLYENYRMSKYIQARKKWEPWYGQNENDIYNPAFTLENIKKRKSTFERELRLSKMNLATNSNVLDYGGDLGQFFPEKFTGAKYLYDLSEIGSQKEDTLIRINSVELIRDKIDLAMLCGVLEHVTDIEVIIREVQSTLRGEGYVYIEVPLDGFEVSKFHATAMYKMYLSILRKYKYLFIGIDLYTGLYRNFFKRVPMFGIVKQSEHINYFSAKSLAFALSSQFEVTYISEPDYKLKHGKFRMGFLAGTAVKRSSKGVL